MNLVQVLALAVALTALAIVLFLRFLRLGQSLYLYGAVALGFLGGIFFGIILRLHNILASWSVNLIFDVVLIIFVIYALSLCVEEIRYHRRHEGADAPAAMMPREPTRAPVDSQRRRGTNL
jgi:hypothetical protein